MRLLQQDLCGYNVTSGAIKLTMDSSSLLASVNESYGIEEFLAVRFMFFGILPFPPSLLQVVLRSNFTSRAIPENIHL